MGYYSEIGLALSKAGVEKLKARLAVAPESTRKEVEDLLACADQHHADTASGSEVWLWNWMKWYSDFEEVSFMENLMDELDYDDYRFIRIGEEYDDTEVEGGFWENPFALELTRSITIQSAA